MAMTRPDETDLLLPLHDGAHEAAPFTLFLQRLRRRVRADAVGLVVRSGTAPWHWLNHLGPHPALDQDRLITLRPHRVYTDEGEGNSRLIRVDEPGGAAAVLVIRRDHADFTAADGALLARLAPHLAIALRTRATLDDAASRAAIAEQALGASRTGWMAFAADGRILAASPSAEPLLESRRATARQFAADAIACMADQAPRIVHLGPEPGQAMLLVPVLPVHAGLAPAPAAIGLIALGRPRVDGPQPGLLAALFGLTGSEARLAAAIAGGASLSESATRLGLTIETARNYSKRLFAKTRTGGQVDLVRLISASVARFATGVPTPPVGNEAGDSRSE
jgi:DNA-binding CsgD family transcriptional regulator